MFAALNLWEAHILAWIETLRLPFLDPLVLFFTHLGDSGFLFVLLTLLLLIFPRTRRVGLATALALVCSLVFTNLLLKNLVHRLRPWEAVDFLRNLVTERDTSFPSGHTSAAFAFALAFLRSDGGDTWAGRTWAKVTAVVLAVCMGLSRLYVGAHYPTDVLAGFVVGDLAGLAGWYLSTRLTGAFSKPRPPTDPPD